MRCTQFHDLLTNPHDEAECDAWGDGICLGPCGATEPTFGGFGYECACAWLMICGAERVPKLYAALEKLERKRK